MSGAGSHARWGLAGRLLAALVVVIAVGAVTAGLVASAVGPGLFNEHLARAGLADNSDAVLHAERAFRDASAVSLALALAAAVFASAAISLVLARRIGRSLAAVSTAAARLGAGRYDTRVPAAGLGAEFDELADSFNTMAVRLQDAERLRARLLADVAHEVRTPVATMVGYLEAVEDGVRPMDEATMTVLRDQAARLTQLAQDLAAVTRAEAGDLTLNLDTVPARELLASAAAAWHERGVAARVDILADADNCTAWVRADRHRIGQVLDNLVANALRHTRAGGTITLHAALTGAGKVTLSVADTGQGIAPDHLPHVFERFYRADTARDRTHGGSGIGLAICKALTEAHGGTITATSPGQDQGTTLTITLEPAPEPAGSAVPTQR